VRISYVILVVLLAAACGGPTKPEPVPAPPPKPEPTPAPTPTPTPAPVDNSAALIEQAKKFVADADVGLRKLFVTNAEADWANQTDITPAHEEAATKTAEALANEITRLIKEARKFEPILTKLDPDTRRQLLLLKFAGQPAPDDPAQSQELAKLQTEMMSVYGKGKVCDTSKPKPGAPKQTDLDALDAKIAAAKDDKARDKLTKQRTKLAEKFDATYCKDLDALSKVLQTSHKPDELLAAWQGWHDTVGKAERPLFTRYVELANTGARGVGFRDVASMWRSGYDMPEEAFETEVDRLWNQVKPLYVQLHCYARRGLNKLYGDKVVPATGPIPTHLTGNMWAQEWEYLYNLLEPYKGISHLDVTPALAKKYTVKKMVQMAEGFYTSLGMNPLPATFWERSMFEKPKGKDVVCHASAWDVAMANDVRIKL
jgi:peptidyl-dipeptidase A